LAELGHARTLSRRGGEHVRYPQIRGADPDQQERKRPTAPRGAPDLALAPRSRERDTDLAGQPPLGSRKPGGALPGERQPRDATPSPSHVHLLDVPPLRGSRASPGSAGPLSRAGRPASQPEAPGSPLSASRSPRGGSGPRFRRGPARLSVAEAAAGCPWPRRLAHQRIALHRDAAAAAHRWLSGRRHSWPGARRPNRKTPSEGAVVVAPALRGPRCRADRLHVAMEGPCDAVGETHTPGGPAGSPPPLRPMPVARMHRPSADQTV